MAGASGQRVWKRHPPGGFTGLGTFPSKTFNSRVLSTTGLIKLEVSMSDQYRYYIYTLPLNYIIGYSHLLNDFLGIDQALTQL
jgi:hypothetical protein